MREVKAVKINAADFAPYGTFCSMTEPEGYPLEGEIHKFYPDRISGTCVGTMAFSPIEVRKDERIVKMAEYHTTTWEGIVALDDDMLIHVAPASGGTPVPELAKAFLVPKGCMVKINAAIWHLCPLPANNEVLHAMIVLPECTYANDCTVVEFEEKDWFKIKQIDFDHGTITGNILGAALPMLVAQILSLLYNIVDRIYIARIPSVGTTALGAVGLCFPIIVIITAFSNLFGSGGDVYISVMTIVSSVRQMVETPIYAINEGTSPILSYNYGAQRPKKVKKAICVLTCMILIYTAIAWSVIIFEPEFLIGIFSTDSELLADCVEALKLYFAAFIFMDLQYVGQTVFKSLNKKKQAIFFSLLRKVFIVVPLTYLFPYTFRMGTRGVFLAEPISNVIGGSLCFITMLVMLKRSI